jgi:hypothetical protein
LRLSNCFGSRARAAGPTRQLLSPLRAQRAAISLALERLCRPHVGAGCAAERGTGTPPETHRRVARHSRSGRGYPDLPRRGRASSGRGAPRAPTLRLGLAVNPLLAAISILTLAGASARLWPGDAKRGRLAILYLATSTQFVLTSMTDQMWAAHLSFNLLWLYLVLRDDRFGLGAAPWVGVAALNLPNPLAHALFAAPFLLRVARSRRLGWIGYYAVVYGAAAIGWFVATAATGRELAFSGRPMADRYLVHAVDLTALLTWQAPAMALFLVSALLHVRSLKPAERDLWSGIVLTLAFHAVFASGDHVLGYGAGFAVLGAAALLAASATVTVAGQRGALMPRLVALSTVLTLLVQLPLRATQAQSALRHATSTIHDGAPAGATTPSRSSNSRSAPKAASRR